MITNNVTPALNKRRKLLHKRTKQMVYSCYNCVKQSHLITNIKFEGQSTRRGMAISWNEQPLLCWYFVISAKCILLILALILKSLWSCVWLLLATHVHHWLFLHLSIPGQWNRRCRPSYSINYESIHIWNGAEQKDSNYIQHVIQWLKLRDIQSVF